MTENITTQRYWEVCGIDVNSQTNHEHAKSGRLTPYLKGGSCECRDYAVRDALTPI